MATTIQVYEGTLKMLKQLRRIMKAPSYDAVINNLVKKKSLIEETHGILGKKSIEWVLKDHRDKTDRF